MKRLVWFLALAMALGLGIMVPAHTPHWHALAGQAAVDEPCDSHEQQPAHHDSTHCSICLFVSTVSADLPPAIVIVQAEALPLLIAEPASSAPAPWRASWTERGPPISL